MKLPLQVKYVYPPNASPIIIDADGAEVAFLPQYAGHPMEYDEHADRDAQQIVNAVNQYMGMRLRSPSPLSLPRRRPSTLRSRQGLCLKLARLAEGVRRPPARGVTSPGRLAGDLERTNRWPSGRLSLSGRHDLD